MALQQPDVVLTRVEDADDENPLALNPIDGEMIGHGCLAVARPGEALFSDEGKRQGHLLQDVDDIVQLVEKMSASLWAAQPLDQVVEDDTHVFLRRRRENVLVNSAVFFSSLMGTQMGAIPSFACGAA